MSFSDSPHLAGPTEDPSTHSAALYPGDTGLLPLETRRALVQLLVGPSLDAKRHSQLWPILLRDEQVVRSRLSELFLDLVVDLDTQVAFTRQADAGDLEMPILLRRSQLTFIDSVLLLHLRRRLSEAQSQGERAAISTGEITEHLLAYERHSNTDHSGFTKRIHASIEKLKKNSVLQKIRSTEDRYEISPTLKLLFSAAEIQVLSREYQRIAEGQTGPGSPTDLESAAKEAGDASDGEDEDIEP